MQRRRKCGLLIEATADAQIDALALLLGLTRSEAVAHAVNAHIQSLGEQDRKLVASIVSARAAKGGR